MDELELGVNEGRLDKAVPLLGMKVTLKVVQQLSEGRVWGRNVDSRLERRIRRADPVRLLPELAPTLVATTHAVHEDEMHTEEQVQ